MDGHNHRETRSRRLQRDEKTHDEESKENETETVLLSPNQSNEENTTKTTRAGRPKSKLKLPPITCGDGQHGKKGRCNCPGTTTCIRCCNKCNDRSPKATNLFLPISCGEWHGKIGRCSCPESTSCMRCCNVCNDSPVTAIERTPWKERPKRSTEVRTDGFFSFEVTDDEGNPENEDEDKDKESVEDNEKSQVELFQTVAIKNAENRTQRKLCEVETDTLTDKIVDLVESKIKPFRNPTAQYKIRSKVIDQLFSKADNTTSPSSSLLSSLPSSLPSSLLREIRKSKDCISSCIVIPSLTQSQNEIVQERDQMMDSILKSLLVETKNSVSYRYLRAVLVEGLSPKHINSLMYTAYDKTNEERKERALFGRKAISSAKEDYKQIVQIGKPLMMKK